MTDASPGAGNSAPGWLRAGIVGRPHGLDGSFHVGSPVGSLLELGGEVTVGGLLRRIHRLAGHERRLIIRLEGADGRDSAEALRGQDILVSRQQAPPLEEEEWWADELEGCAVHDGERAVGIVQRLMELPSCEVLEVERSDGGPLLLVPLVRDAVREVDVAARRIDIDLRFLGES